MNTHLTIIIFALSLLPGNLLNSNKRTTAILHETAAEEAKPHFEKGLLLLHNFEYEDAAEEFITAQQKDPGFALAYWGEAMTYDHPIWRDLNIERSRAALNKIGKTPAERASKGKTALEKDFIQGIEVLFGEGSKPAREKAYATHMAKMYDKYPANHDVGAFYALSLLAIKKGWDHWEDYNVQAEAIANKILAADPNHAGALHYLVHADDHPQYAGNGLGAADKYAKVASYAGHALHMPSHIYLALGMWDDVVRSNEVSWQAGVDRKEKKKLNNNQLNYHAHLWLTYGYLQQGRFQRAKTLIDNQVKYVNELSSPRARFHLMEMKGHYLFHTNDWSSAVAAISIKTDDLDHRGQYTNSFLEGYKLYYQSKADDLKKHIDDFEKLLTRSTQLQKASEDIAVCGVTRYANAIPAETDIKTGNKYLNQLKGLHAWLLKDMTATENFFKEALPEEGSVVVGPPSFLLSPNEVYANFLLTTNRPAEALQQFEKALAASPKRLIALKGKLAAAKALKDVTAELKVREQLQQMLKNADAVASKGLW